MLTVQIVSILVSGLIAYYISRSGPRWRIVPALALAMIIAWIVGMAAGLIWAEGNAAAVGRGIGAAFWFSILGAIGGLYFGRKEASRELRDAATEKLDHSVKEPFPTNAHSRATEGNEKVAQLEVKLGRQKPELFRKARESCGDEDDARINREYIKLRTEQLRGKQTTSENTIGQSATRTPKTVSRGHDHTGVLAVVVIVVFLIGGLSLMSVNRSTRDECIEAYVHPAQHEMASRILRQSCYRQFEGDAAYNVDREQCFREKLPELSTGVAVWEAVRTCKDVYDRSANNTETEEPKMLEIEVVEPKPSGRNKEPQSSTDSRGWQPLSEVRRQQRTQSVETEEWKILEREIVEPQPSDRDETSQSAGDFSDWQPLSEFRKQKRSQ